MTPLLRSPHSDTQANPSQSLTTAGRQALLLRVIPLLIFVVLAVCVFRYAVSVPILDQWALLPLLEKSYQHPLAWHDFWDQHNEHRLVFPRLIMLPCARLSGWDLRWELAVNLLLGAGIYAALVYQLRQTEAARNEIARNEIAQTQAPESQIAQHQSAQNGTLQTGIADTLTSPTANTFRWLNPVVALIVFSFRQSENWVWGWQLQIFLNVLAVVVGAIALTGRPFTLPRLMLGMACGIVATYSFANGMLFWIVGGLALLALPRTKSKPFYLTAWSIVGGLTIASYRYHYSDSPVARESFVYALHHPVAFGLYVVSYLGGLLSVGNLEAHPMLGMLVLAAPAGLFGLGAIAWAMWKLRAQNTPLTLLLPYYILLAYVFLSAIVSAAGRISMGLPQSLASRYTTISQLFWVCALTLVFLAVQGRKTQAGSKECGNIGIYGALSDKGESKAGALLAATQAARGKELLIISALVFALFSAINLPRVPRHYRAIQTALEQMDANPAKADPIFPNYWWLKQQQATLKRLHLNIYR